MLKHASAPCLTLRQPLEAKEAVVRTYFDEDRGGNRTPKDALDPTHLCELGAFAPLLPWEVAHRVEWTLEGLQIGHNRPIAYAVYGGSEAAGVQGHIRFWPAGYWSKAQQQTRERATGLLDKFDHRGLSTPPAFNSWCGIAACLPTGSHLVLRFFIGDETSERRECFWSGGAHADSLWAPTSTKPPQDLRAGAVTGGGSIRVGVEILRNLAVQRHTKNVARSLLVPMSSELCRAKRPLLLAAPSFAGVPKGATALGGALRAAALHATGSFGKLPPPLPPAQRKQLAASSMREERWGEPRQSTLAPSFSAPEVSFSVADQEHVL